jgi:hypothetical protein
MTQKRLNLAEGNVAGLRRGCRLDACDLEIARKRRTGKALFFLGEG